jgi:hypothetical protein
MPQQDPEYVGVYRISVTVDVAVEDSVESVARAQSILEAMEEAAAKMDGELQADEIEWYSDGREEESLGWTVAFEEVARQVVEQLRTKTADPDSDVVREHVECELFDPTTESVDIVTKEVRKRLEETPPSAAKQQPWCYRVDDTDIGGDGYAAGPFADRNEAYQSAKSHAMWLADRREVGWAEFDEWTFIVTDDLGQPGDSDTVWFYIEQMQEPVSSTPVNRSI